MRRKEKNRLVLAILIGSFGVLLSGCGKDTDNKLSASEDSKVSEDFVSTLDGADSSAKPSSEQISSEDNQDTSTEDSQSQSNDKENLSLFEVSEELFSDGSVMAVGVYDDTHVIAFCEKEQGSEVERRVSIVDVYTGETNECSRISFDKPENYVVGASAYRLTSSSPLIVVNRNNSSLIVYNQTLTAYSEIYVNNYTIESAFYSEVGNCIYFKDVAGKKIYRLPYDSLENVCNYNKDFVDVWPIVEAIQYDSQEFAYVNLDGISSTEDALYCSAGVIGDDIPVFFKYNVQAAEIEYVKSADFEHSTYYGIEERTKFIGDDGIAYGTNISLYDYVENKQYSMELDLESIVNSKVIYEEMKQSDGNEMGMPCEGAHFGRAYYDSTDFYLGDRILIPVMDDIGSRIYTAYVWNYKSPEYEKDLSVPAPEDSYYTLYEYSDMGVFAEKIKYFHENYGIKLVMGKDVSHLKSYYDMAVMEDVDRISAAISEIDEALKWYPEGFVKEVISCWSDDMVIYLTGDITDSNGGPMSMAGGIAWDDNNTLYFAIDIGYNNIQSTVIHEMTHSVDHTLQKLGVYEEQKQAWCAYNPESFSYVGYDGYPGDFDNTYLGMDYFDSNDPEVIYFARDYSKSTCMEDRATLVEYLYYIEGHEMIYESSHIKDKMRVYRDCLKSNFKSFSTFEKSQFGIRYAEVIEE